MRPQQNRRMRGRSSGGGNNGNQNRKGPNPLTRNYESNGPDVKIRGSAQQIAEKYATLARDAQSSGDRVMAENYLQHAEHYNRIIMAAQAQMPQQQIRDNRDDDDADEDGDENVAPAQQAEQPRQRHHEQAARREERHDEERNDGSGPQPVIEGFPAALTQESEAPARTRTPRRREAPKTVATTEEAPKQEADSGIPVAAEVAPVGEAAAPEDLAQEEEAPRRVRRPRRPRIKAEAEGTEEAPASGEEVVTEAAQ